MTLPPQDGDEPEPREAAASAESATPSEPAETTTSAAPSEPREPAMPADVAVADAGPAATDPDGIPTVDSPPPSAPPGGGPPPSAPPYGAPPPSPPQGGGAPPNAPTYATSPPSAPPYAAPPPFGAPPYAAPPPNAPPLTAPFGAAPPYQEPYGPAYAAEGLPLGGRWRRLFAGIVDAIIVAVLTGLVTGAVGRAHSGYTARDGVADVLGLVIGIAYFWIQHGAWGQTLGKRIFQLRVVDLSGGRITWAQAGIRVGFQYLISVVTCGIGEVVDLAWILFDRRKQALHDKVAKTLVVSARP